MVVEERSETEHLNCQNLPWADLRSFLGLRQASTEFIFPMANPQRRLSSTSVSENLFRLEYIERTGVYIELAPRAQRKTLKRNDIGNLCRTLNPLLILPNILAKILSR
jgi:hypothetical protein